MNAFTPAMAALTQTLTSAPLDGAILSLRDEFRAAVAKMAEINRTDDVSDEELDSVVSRFNAACAAIVDSPPAQTRAGLALKAAAAKQQLRGEFNLEIEGEWPDRSLEMVWHVLTEIAGDEYFSSACAEWEPPSRSPHGANS